MIIPILKPELVIRTLFLAVSPAAGELSPEASWVSAPCVFFLTAPFPLLTLQVNKGSMAGGGRSQPKPFL